MTKADGADERSKYVVNECCESGKKSLFLKFCRENFSEKPSLIDVETGGWDFALRATHWRLQRVVLVTNAEPPPEANRFSDFAHRRGVARLLRIVRWGRAAAKVGTRKLRMRSGYPPSTPEKHPQNQVLGLRVLYINLASRQDRDREFKAVISEASLPNATRGFCCS